MAPPPPAAILARAPWPSRYKPPPFRVDYDAVPRRVGRPAPTPLPALPPTPPPPSWVACAAAAAGAELVAVWIPALTAAGPDPLAALGAALLLDQEAGREAALTWLRAWPEAAVVGLLPTVVGPPCRRQLLAQLALAEAAACAPERAHALAAEQGSTAPEWVALLRTDGPVDPRDWFRSRPPPAWAAPEQLPRLDWADGTPVAAKPLASFLTRVRRSRLADPYLHLDVVRDALDSRSLDALAGALVRGWVEAGAPKEELWAADQVAFWGGPLTAAALTAARPAGRDGAPVRERVAALDGLGPPEVRAALAGYAPAPRPAAPLRRFDLTDAERDYGFRRFDGRALRPTAGVALRDAGWKIGGRSEHRTGATELYAKGPGDLEVVLELHGELPFRRPASPPPTVARVGLPGIPRLPLPDAVRDWLDTQLTALEDQLFPGP